MLERVQYYFREVRGLQIRRSQRRAGGRRDHAGGRRRAVGAIAEVRPTPDFEPLAASFKRIHNILKQANFTPGPLSRPTLLEEGPEKELYDAYVGTQDAGGSGRDRGAASGASTIFRQGHGERAGRERPRKSTHFIAQLLLKFSTIADFSEIVTSGDKNEKIRL